MAHSTTARLDKRAAAITEGDTSADVFESKEKLSDDADTVAAVAVTPLTATVKPSTREGKLVDQRKTHIDEMHPALPVIAAMLLKEKRLAEEAVMPTKKVEEVVCNTDTINVELSRKDDA